MELVIYLFLYDLLPGGAGYTRMVKNNLEVVFDEAQKILEHCDCEQSCYNCLRHYGNNYIHSQLDRTLALDLLTYLRTGVSPSLGRRIKDNAIKTLSEVLNLKEIEYSIGGDYPLTVINHGQEFSISLHHPLTKAENKSAVLSLDTYTLIHDTPATISKIEAL